MVDSNHHSPSAGVWTRGMMVAVNHRLFKPATARSQTCVDFGRPPPDNRGLWKHTSVSVSIARTALPRRPLEPLWLCYWAQLAINQSPSVLKIRKMLSRGCRPLS